MLNEANFKNHIHKEIVEAILAIMSSVEIIMAEAVEMQGVKRMNMQQISNQFFTRCGIPANKWGFCDSLFLRLRIPNLNYLNLLSIKLF